VDIGPVAPQVIHFIAFHGSPFVVGKSVGFNVSVCPQKGQANKVAFISSLSFCMLCVTYPPCG
jgi:hypothetical protein